MKWKKQHMQTETFSIFDQGRNAHAVFLEKTELVEWTICTLFEKVVSPLIELLLHETNQYINKHKKKPQFKATLEELKNFIGWFFCKATTLELQNEISGVLILILDVMYFVKQWAEIDSNCNQSIEFRWQPIFEWVTHR